MPRRPRLDRPGGFLGVRARLLGLVLIPSVGLAVSAGGELQEQRALVEDARLLAADVETASVAVDAFVATAQEYRLAETAKQAANFGVSVEVAGELLGMDLLAELDVARSRVDASPLLPELLAAAGLDDRVALDAARRDLDATGENDRHFAALVVDAEQRWLDAVSRIAVEDDGSLQPELRDALHGFETSADLFRMANEELLHVSELAVPGSAVRRTAAEDIHVVIARFQAALDLAEADADEHVRPALDLVVGDRAFEDVIEDLQLEDGSILDPVALGRLFEVGLRRNANLEALIAVTSADARSHAITVGDAAQRRYDRALLVVIALVVATLGLALLVARSIAIPLRRVARRAGEISDGELAGEALRVTGPPETAVLARALNDTAENLRAVESRMSALAAGDLETAAGVTAPGKLGELVGRSVDGLAHALTAREKLERRLAHEAAHDSLTGLANRRTAMSRLDAMLTANERVGLLFLDLDGFKLVNDVQGHAVGDRLLGVAADRLARFAPEGAVVARLGGDEFVVSMPVTTAEEAVQLAQHLARILDEQVNVDGLPHRVAVSVGVAVSHPDDDADRLLRWADAALYEAKRAGRGSVVLLDEHLRATLESQQKLEADLQEAIAANRMELHYQPVFEAAGALHGVEALVRWRREDGTLVPPDDFIPAAERSGLIADLDRWVLVHALEQIGMWRRGAFPDLRLSVNVSASTLLSTHLVGNVAAALERSGVGGDALVVEVTETALLHDLDTAAEHITRLRDLGVRTSVDDFGTGYTSVSHLRRLPVTEVKIDRSFVQAMSSDDRDRVLVDLVVRIGNVLSLDVVAEGVETEEQLETLRRLGCRFAQGYFLGRPLRADELEASLTAVAPA